MDAGGVFTIAGLSRFWAGADETITLTLIHERNSANFTVQRTDDGGLKNETIFTNLSSISICRDLITVLAPQKDKPSLRKEDFSNLIPLRIKSHQKLCEGTCAIIFPGRFW